MFENYHSTQKVTFYRPSKEIMRDSLFKFYPEALYSALTLLRFQVPEGSSVHEDGSIVAADGTVLAPPGSVILAEDGTLMMTQDGAMLMQGDDSHHQHQQAYQQMVEHEQQENGGGGGEAHSEQQGAAVGGGEDDGGGGGDTSAGAAFQEEQHQQQQPQQQQSDDQNGGKSQEEQMQPDILATAVESSENGSIFSNGLGHEATSEGQAALSIAAAMAAVPTNEEQFEAGPAGDSRSFSTAPIAESTTANQLALGEEPVPPVSESEGPAAAGAEMMTMAEAATSILGGGDENFGGTQQLPVGGQGEGEPPTVMYTTAEEAMFQQPYAPRQAIYTTADGTVVSAPEGTLMANADGNLVTADGTVLTTEDGTPVSLHGSILSHSGPG